MTFAVRHKEKLTAYGSFYEHITRIFVADQNDCVWTATKKNSPWLNPFTGALRKITTAKWRLRSGTKKKWTRLDPFTDILVRGSLWQIKTSVSIKECQWGKLDRDYLLLRAYYSKSRPQNDVCGPEQRKIDCDWILLRAYYADPCGGSKWVCR